MTKRQRLPIIALVGRPNVGKSRLFNRFVGSRKAIVENTPGVTRDRNYGSNKWNNRPFTIIDTGGFEPDSTDVLLEQMRIQAQLAVEEADVQLDHVHVEILQDIQRRIPAAEIVHFHEVAVGL